MSSTSPNPAPQAMPSRPPRGEGAGSDLEALLRRTFGHQGFRAHQREVCEAAAAGRDVLLVMPTGAGKSLCYQIPALARGGTALVISPLIALMDDQYTKLAAAGLRVARIHSGLDREDARQACRDYLSGALDFLLIAPERLRVPGFAEMLARRKPALVAIDEAHCISQWGHDFRPDYRTLGRHLPALRPAPIMALTATATPSVQQDILRQLELTDPAVFITGFRRDNLHIEVVELSKPERPAHVERLLRDDDARPAIVYAPSRKSAEELASRLATRFPAAAYHAGLDPATRERVQRAFLEGKLDVVVATVAFGMGVDKANVRTVVHVALPGSVEAYYQEIGRAGRDGLPSRTVLLHSFADRRTQEFLLEKSYPARTDLERAARALDEEFLPIEDLQFRAGMDRETLERALEKLCAHGAAETDGGGAFRRTGNGPSEAKPRWHGEYDAQVAARKAQLDRMIAFAENPGCRMTALVRHFGDRTDSGKPCGHCDICQPGAGGNGMRQADPDERRNLRMILSALERGPRSIGQLFKDLELTPDRRRMEGWIDALARAGLITVTAETFRAQDGRDVPFRKAAITAEGHLPDEATMDTVWLRDQARSGTSKKAKSVRQPTAEGRPRTPPSADRTTWTDEQTAFGEKVRLWRKSRASETGMPPFIVFADRVLEQLVEQRPQTLAELGRISGLGTQKIDSFGAELIALCRGEGDVSPGKASPVAIKATARPAKAPAKASIPSEELSFEAATPQRATPVSQPRPLPVKPVQARPAPALLQLNPAQTALEERLRAWRKQEATTAGLPSFFIFSDTVLRLIAAAEPKNLAELANLQGVGRDKAERFGPAVLGLCQA